MTLVLGEIDVARAKPAQPGGKPPVRQAAGTNLFSQGGRQLPGTARCPLMPGGRRPPGLDYVGHRGMGMTCGEDKKGIGCAS